MMRILISGYYGFGNAGDEAILRGTLESLRMRLPGCEYTVLSADPDGTRTAYGVQAVDRWDKGEVWRAIGEAGLALQGGGGLLQDATSQRSPLYYLAILYAARLRRTPYMVYAQGMGPLSGGLNRWLTGRLVRGAAAVSVRDEVSKTLLAELGVPEERVEVTADAAALLDPVPYEDTAWMLPPREAGPRVAFALREYPGCEGLVEGAVEAARVLRDEEGAQVVPLALHPGDEVVAEMLGSVKKGSDPFSVVRVVELVVAMRLHAAIFAAASGVPFVGLAYDPKVKAFAQSVGSRWVPAEATAEEVVAAVREAWEARDSEREARQEAAERLRRAAERNVEMVAEVVARISP